VSRLGIAAKAGYVASCLMAAAVMVFSGYAHKVVSLVRGTAQGIMIKNSPSVGAMNILVMGLESRTDYHGNTLPNSLLTAMHAGNATAVSKGQVGAQDTNTLILIHIFPGGQKAVGFSIPRDDLVDYPHASYLGITKGKIDQAYDFAYNESLQQTSATKDSHDQRFLLANQAGQQFEIDTVQALTGVHIDHFVEVNLAGFFYLASAFHGIEVCIKPYPGNHGLNLTDFDPNSGINHSGFNAYHDGYNQKKGGAQYLHLWAPQALAFVRSRDTLPGTDIGRTARQQATIDYVVWKLRHDGALSDLGTLNSLLDTANKYLITDASFNLLDFATDMRALSGSHVRFQTLLPQGQVNGMPLNGFNQDVNIINVADTQQIVKSAFYPQANVKKPAGKGKPSPTMPTTAPPATITVDVYNGGTTFGLAGKMSAALVALGYKAGAIKNASAQSQAVQPGTQVFYGAGAAANAEQIAAESGTAARALPSLPAHHIEVLIGSAVTAVPAGLTQPGSATASPQSVAAQLLGTQPATAAEPVAASGGIGGIGNGTVSVAPNAPYGIPCVY